MFAEDNDKLYFCVCLIIRALGFGSIALECGLLGVRNSPVPETPGFRPPRPGCLEKFWKSLGC